MLCLQAEAYGMLGLNILAFLQVRYLHVVVSNAYSIYFRPQISELLERISLYPSSLHVDLLLSVIRLISLSTIFQKIKQTIF